MSYFVYILRCADETLYTGITTDLDKRLLAHNLGKNGAKYTRTRRPVRIVYSELLPDRSQALKREYEIKKMTRDMKEELISS